MWLAEVLCGHVRQEGGVRKGAVFSIELHVLYLPLITSHNIPQELDYSYLRNGQVSLPTGIPVFSPF